LPANDLPLLPPAVELESKLVLRTVADARERLAELKVVSEPLTHQEYLLRVLLLQEAKASCEIENIVTTNDKLYSDLSPLDVATKEVKGYAQGYYDGRIYLQEHGRFSTDLFLRLVSAFKPNVTDFRQRPGTRLMSSQTGEIIYTPPDNPETIQGLIANLVEFLNAQAEVDALVQMAISHYQFEAIHPFPDGNGRVGRLLNTLFLYHRGLVVSPMLYLSRPINQRRTIYYDFLRRVTEEGEWEPFIVFMLTVVEEAASDAVRVCRSIARFQIEMREAMRRILRRRFKHEVCELVLQKPYVRIKDIVEQGLLQRETAAKQLSALADAGILEKQRRGRDVVFVNRRLIEALSLE